MITNEAVLEKNFKKVSEKKMNEFDIYLDTNKDC